MANFSSFSFSLLRFGGVPAGVEFRFVGGEFPPSPRVNVWYHIPLYIRMFKTMLFP